MASAACLGQHAEQDRGKALRCQIALGDAGNLVECAPGQPAPGQGLVDRWHAEGADDLLHAADALDVRDPGAQPREPVRTGLVSLAYEAWMVHRKPESTRYCS